MPDLPSPQDATEAVLFSECWDAVLSYADLCTSGSAAAAQLAREAFARGIREIRAAEAGTVRGTGRRSSRLPRIPLLLTAVRGTAAAWEEAGQGHRLDPDLRLWLHSDRAARYTGPPLERPVALRGLRDLQQTDAELLWLAEVEALPLPLVARRLGIAPDTAAEELAQVRGVFRDRCRRNHLDSPMAAECRGYARLLDAVTRSPASDTPGAPGVPGDLSRHLATCAPCAEAAACLRLHDGGLPGALAGGVIGWGGLAYLERRRRAAEVRLGTGHRDGTEPEHGDPEHGDPADGTAGARLARNGLLAAAVLVSALALAVSLMPFGGTDAESAADPGTDRRPATGPGPSLPPAPAAAPTPSAPEPQGTSTSAPSGSPEPPARRTPDRDEPAPEPQGTSTSTATAAPGTAGPGEPPPCRVAYDLADQWSDGFQATVTVTTHHPLDSWRVGFSFRDGQRIRQIWDATVRQDGPRVTVTAADYNRKVPAGGKVAFGFLGSWRGANSPPSDFTLDGRPCAKA